MNENFWVKIDGEIAVIGITEYAQGMLGEITFVELPQIGKKTQIGEEVGTIESLKAISPIISPIVGEIIEVNAILEKKPELINKQPLTDGWIWKMNIK